MKSSLIKTFMAFHKWVYQNTGGRLGYRALHHRFLLLHTVGRRSKMEYVTPLSFFMDDGNYILVASNWGRLDHPHWFKNLQENSETYIQVSSQKIPVQMVLSEGEEYEHLWKLVTHLNRHYARYQSGLAREIPIVILKPSGGDASLHLQDY